MMLKEVSETLTVFPWNSEDFLDHHLMTTNVSPPHTTKLLKVGGLVILERALRYVTLLTMLFSHP